MSFHLGQRVIVTNRQPLEAGTIERLTPQREHEANVRLDHGGPLLKDVDTANLVGLDLAGIVRANRHNNH